VRLRKCRIRLCFSSCVCAFLCHTRGTRSLDYLNLRPIADMAVVRFSSSAPLPCPSVGPVALLNVVVNVEHREKSPSLNAHGMSLYPVVVAL
jgi:hypothetical protein